MSEELLSPKANQRKPFTWDRPQCSTQLVCRLGQVDLEGCLSLGTLLSLPCMCLRPRLKVWQPCSSPLHCPWSLLLFLCSTSVSSPGAEGALSALCAMLPDRRVAPGRALLQSLLLFLWCIRAFRTESIPAFLPWTAHGPQPTVPSGRVGLCL